MVDLLVIGGGINGAGIARDAAGRGLATVLVERGDLVPKLFEGDHAFIRAPSDAEVDYLCRAVNRYLGRPVGRSAVVWSYAGVRPLHDDGSADPSAVTRDYSLRLDDEDGAPVLSVYGGKITTYRRLAPRERAGVAEAIGR